MDVWWNLLPIVELYKDWKQSTIKQISIKWNKIFGDSTITCIYSGIDCPVRQFRDDPAIPKLFKTYRQTSNIDSKNLNVFRLALQLSLSNPLKPVVKSRMEMQLDRRCSNRICVINKFIAY